MQSTSIKRTLMFFAAAALAACVHHPRSQVTTGTLWHINSLASVNQLPTAAEGNPKILETPYGKAVIFDGEGDRLLIANNPLDDASEFTIEILFKPADAFPDNLEPRFFHVEAADNPNRRITIELRLNDQHQWYLDTYIKSEKSQMTLIDSSLVHPVEEWARAAITYKNRVFTAYVNGKKELSGEVDYLPIAENGITSIGARMNRVHWFNGAILAVRITPKVLQPEDFLQFEDLSGEQ